METHTHTHTYTDAHKDFDEYPQYSIVEFCKNATIITDTSLPQVIRKKY